MGKQKVLKNDILHDDLQNDLKSIKEALEIQSLKDEIIGNILLENDREKLCDFAKALSQIKSELADSVKDVKKTPAQGDS